MNTRYYLFLLSSLLFFFAKAENDTLRIYDPDNVLTNTYNTSTYPTQIARFDLPKPAIIKGF
jgi:hypothetical protein